MPDSFLVIDDDTDFAKALCSRLESRGFTAHCAHNLNDALSVINNTTINKIVLDLRLQREDGIELLKSHPEISINASVVVLTGYGSINNAVSAIKLGAKNFLQKPVNLDALLAAFETEHSEDSFSTPTLDEIEKLHIQRVLDDEGGNISHAAKKLGLHRRSLQRKIKKVFGLVSS